MHMIMSHNFSILIRSNADPLSVSQLELSAKTQARGCLPIHPTWLNLSSPAFPALLASSATDTVKRGGNRNWKHRTGALWDVNKEKDLSANELYPKDTEIGEGPFSYSEHFDLSESGGQFPWSGKELTSMMSFVKGSVITFSSSGASSPLSRRKDSTITLVRW